MSEKSRDPTLGARLYASLLRRGASMKAPARIAHLAIDLGVTERQIRAAAKGNAAIDSSDAMMWLRRDM